MNAKTGRNHKRERASGPKGGRVHNPPKQYMTCARCGGAMLFERFQAAVEIFCAWRCVNCGDIIDPVVRKNRELVMLQKQQAAG